MKETKSAKSGGRTQFSVRPHVYPGHYQFVATTARGRCYQLGFTAPMEPTLANAQEQWEKARGDWEPDNSGGAGTVPLVTSWNKCGPELLKAVRYAAEMAEVLGCFSGITAEGRRAQKLGEELHVRMALAIKKVAGQ